MNKKILAAAIGAAMVVPVAAHADIKVSGRVAADLISLPNPASGYVSTQPAGASGITFADWGQSRLQFDGSTDSGLFARAALDTRPLFFKITVPMAPRDIYFGYKGDFGSLSVGRMGGAVKNLEGDPFIATFLELRNNAYEGGSYGSSSFIDNTVQYANTFGGTSIKIQYDPIDDSTAAGQGGIGDTKTYNGAMGIGVKAKLAGANVFLGYNNQGNPAAGGTANSYFKVGGNMTFSGIKVSLGYQSLSGNGATSHSNFILGGEMNLGSGSLIDVTYSDKGLDQTNAYYRVAYMKKMGKGGDIHVGYVNNGAFYKNAVDVGNTGVFGAGVTVKF